MPTLKLAAAPMLLVALWMVASVHTISELTTVVPALRVEQAASPPMQHALRAIAQARSAPRRVP